MENWETPKTVRTIPSRFDTYLKTENVIEDTRKQIKTELDILQLKDQVQQLGSLVQRGLSRNLQDEDDDDDVIRDLEAERDELRVKLERSEFLLTESQSEIVDLRNEFREQSTHFRRQIEELENSVRDEIREKAKIKANYEKCIKTITGLKGYLKDLPSIEEHNDVKSSLRAKEDSYRKLETELEFTSRQCHSQENEIQNLRRQIADLTSKNDEMAIKLELTEEKLRNNERRREEALKFDDRDAENLLAQNDAIKIENAKLKKYIHVLKLRHKKEMEALNVSVTQGQELISKLKEDLKFADERSVKYGETADLLRNDLKTANEKLLTSQKKCQVLSTELSNAQNVVSMNDETDRYVKQLVFELGHCLTEIESLSVISKQIIEGDDPNVSALLGIGRSRITTDLNEPDDSDRLSLLRNQLDRVQKIKAEISESRQMVSDKYAEHLGNNMTSCITQ